MIRRTRKSGWSLLAVCTVMLALGGCADPDVGTREAADQFGSPAPPTIREPVQRPEPSASAMDDGDNDSAGGDDGADGGEDTDAEAGRGDCAAYVDSAGWCTDGIGDYDCEGGSGNGPNYAPREVEVAAPGVDPFGLDRDSDGEGCQESGPAAPAPPPPGDGTDPRFGTCGEAIAAGYGHYYRGQDPEYDWYRDADGDGVVCE